MKKITLLIVMSLLPFLGFAQFPEGFEGGVPPAGWTVSNNGVGTGQEWVVNTAFPRTGTRAAFVNTENIGVGNTSEDWLTSPLVTIPTNGQFRFWLRQLFIGDQGSIIKVMVSTTSQTDHTTFVPVRQWTEFQLNDTNNTSYFEHTADFPAIYFGQQVYIAIVRQVTQTAPAPPNPGDRILLDDLNLVQKCLDPTGLNATSITTTTASLSWLNPSGATQWELELVNITAGGTPTGAGTVINQNPYPQTGLSPGTNYHFYVRALCSNGINSEWIGPLSFATKSLGSSCAEPIPAVGLPYTHTSNTLIYSDTIDGSPGTSCGITGNYLNGNEVIYSYTATFTGNILINMTPSGANSGLFVYGSCAAIGNTCLAGVGNTGTGPRTITSFPVTNGTTYYIVISTNGTPQTIDYTLTIQQVNCQAPNALAVSGVTTTAATLQWGVTGTATSWEYVLQPVGGGLPLGSGITVGTNSATVGPLTPSTQYEFYVRADCGNGTFSTWAGPFTFYTLCAPYTVPFFEGFNTGSTSQRCWTVLNVNADANQWDMDYATTPYEGDHSASINSATATNNDWLISPQITLNGNQRVRYRYRVGSAASPANFEVKVSTTGPAAANFTTTILTQTTYNNATYLEKVINMNGIVGDVNIGWHVAPGTNGSRIFIDAVYVEDIPPCPEPTDIVVSAITNSSATVNWAAGFTENTWQIVVQPTGTPAPTLPTQGVTVTPTPTYSVTGLTGSAIYDVYILANCGVNGASIWVGPVSFTTQVTPPACGGQFMDSGGTLATYSINEDLTWTISPVNAGDVVTVTFSAFDTQANSDALYVFDGNSIAAPQISSVNGAGTVPGGLAGGFWGSTIPGPFTSTAADGSLTFRFRSNGATNLAGWLANVTCAPRPTCEAPRVLTQSAVTYNSVNLAWTGGNASAWEVIAVPCGSPRPTGSTAGWVSAPTNPFTLTGLTELTCYDFYVRGICSPTDASTVTGPVSASTPITPPFCGSNFYDPAGPAADYAANTNNTVTICPTNPGDAVTVSFSAFNLAANDILRVYDGPTAASPILASLTGTTIPNSFSASSPSGCLTFVFTSNATVQAAGWTAAVTCAPLPNCTRPTTLTATNPTSTSALLGWAETGTSTQWEIYIVPFGSPPPGPTSTGIIVGVNPALVTGLNPSTQYTFYVRAICPTSGTSYWSLTSASFFTAPANDECAAAILAPVNSNAVCAQTVPGSLSNATASTGPAVCGGGNANDDVWYQFIATNTYLNVSLQNVVGSTTDIDYAVYSGTCGSFTQILCSTTGTGTLNGLTVGQMYYVRVYSFSATAATTTFDLCISTPSTCATSSTVCNITYGNTTGVTNLGTIGCLGTSPNPTYFTIQVTQSGPISYVLTQSSPGSPTPDLDVDYAAWGPFTSQAAGCAAGIPFIAPTNTNPSGDPQDHGCSYSALPVEQFNIPNAIAGQFYIILITNFSDDPGSISFTQTNAGAPGAGVTFCCPDANFSYTPSTYCKGSSANPIAVLAPGAVAGVYSAAPAGVVFVNTATGEIDLAASTAGNYVITNTLVAAGSCIQKTFSYVISIKDPVAATISYGAASYCNSLAGTQAVTVTGTPGGTFSVSPVGLFINTNTGAITPTSSAPGTYTVSYNFSTANGCGTTSFTTTVTISPTPSPAPVITQPTCTTPTGTITVMPAQATYEYSITGGAPYFASNIFSGLAPNSTHTVSIRDTATGCSSAPFPVVIGVVPSPPPAPVIQSVVQPTCTTEGQIVIQTPTQVYSNLFISEVTDANVGSLTYIEIFNGTGAPVNLTGYKLKIFNNGGGSPSTNCDFALTGTLANNAVRVIAVGSATNQGGVIPHQVVASCAGINIDDNIRLTTSADVEIDNWGRRDGITFTPNNLPGYTYRRLSSAIAPSNTWNPADWTALDPEVYTNVGSYTPLAPNYQYSIDGTNYQTSTTFTGVADGTYNVTAMNAGCVSPATPVTLTDPVAPTATISYSAPSAYCSSDLTPQAVLLSGTGDYTGGTYSAGTGLTINAVTGEITPGSSTPGTYTVTYTVPVTINCPMVTTTTSVTIDEAPTAAISYSPAAFCTADTGLYAVSLTGTGSFSGGTYSSIGGLTINATTGEITPGTSTPGIHTVTYTIPANGTCPSTTVTTTVTIDQAPTASISYTPAVFCSTDTTTYFVTLSGTGNYSGGTYSGTAGLLINAVTGEITPSGSTPGAHTVTYTVPANGSCLATTVTTSVTIDQAPTAVISYSPNAYCSTDTAIYPVTLSGTGLYTGGSFSGSAGLIIDSVTGAITPLGSTVGGHTVTYTMLANGTCPATFVTTTVTIDQAPTAAISYSAAAFCTTTTASQTVSLTGTGNFTGGSYSAASGLTIDAVTGAITPSTSTPGLYTVTYAIPANGSCGSTSVTTSVTIDAAPTAVISYDALTFCSSDTGTQAVTVTGTGAFTGGTFTATPAGLQINASTGAISSGTSTPGTYVITYMIPANGTCAAVPVQTSVTIEQTVSVTVEQGCMDGNYTLSAIPNDASLNYEWHLLSSTTVLGTSADLIVTAAGTYVVDVTSFGSCVFSAQVVVTNTICDIPKGISPNNDGLNDEFDLSTLNVTKLSIFNRYGSAAYSHGSGYTDQWHGQSSGGQELPDGTYYYVIDTADGQTRTGWVYINRER